MIEVPCDKTRMFPVVDLSLRVSAAYMVAGMMSEVAATAIKEDMVEAMVGLKLLSWRLMPEAMKQLPSTSRMFDKIDPNILDCTIRISPLTNAITET